MRLLAEPYGSAASWLVRLSQGVVTWHAAIEPNGRVPTLPLWLAVALSAATISVALTAR
jgi:hypothetical protein